MFSLISVVFSCCFLQPHTPPPANAATPVRLHLESSAVDAAPVRLAVYASSEAFRDEKPFRGFVQSLQGGRADVEITVPAPGSYVFAAFHDLNDNGKLDRNFFGIPTEPYGFTESPASKWRAPSFDEVATRVTDATRAEIHLRNWKEY